jgi:hypothetical protein
VQGHQHDRPDAARSSSRQRHAAPVSIELAPGATAWSTWDLADWAKRRGGKPLAGSLSITATYNAGREKDVWHGKIETQFGVTLP